MSKYIQVQPIRTHLNMRFAIPTLQTTSLLAWTHTREIALSTTTKDTCKRVIIKEASKFQEGEMFQKEFR
jgi:hypothetical protein